MDAKLKSLKVADLKEICTRANIPTTTRLTKADLISKILASQSAIDVYNVKYQQNGNTAPLSKPVTMSSHDDILAPPEEVDWTLEVPTPPDPTASIPPKATKFAPPSPQTKVTPSKVAPESPKTSVPAPAPQVDEELEKRKARAARFGIALVEPPKPKTKSSPAPTPVAKVTKAPEDSEKLKARTERFGPVKGEQKGATTVPAVGNKKRSAAVAEEVDLEEQERRRKRAERFGIPVASATA